MFVKISYLYLHIPYWLFPIGYPLERTGFVYLADPNGRRLAPTLLLPVSAAPSLIQTIQSLDRLYKAPERLYKASTDYKKHQKSLKRHVILHTTQKDYTKALEY